MKHFETLIVFGDTIHQSLNDKYDFNKENPLYFSDTGVVFNFGIKKAGKYSSLTVDTHGYIEYHLTNTAFEYVNGLEIDPREIPTHRCTVDDFADFDFYGNTEAAQRNLLSKMCYNDPGSMNMYGSADSETGSIIIIDVARCKNHEYCKSDIEIDEFL